MTPPLFRDFLGSWYKDEKEDRVITGRPLKCVIGCGKPRSELTSCSRRTEEDPQFTINLGNWPTSSLVHRQSLTQNFQCIGSWKEEEG
jgi:hypothetical protein